MTDRDRSEIRTQHRNSGEICLLVDCSGKLAPFHLLASEGAVHSSKDHLWHMGTIGRICQAETRLLLATPFQVVDLTDRAEQDKGITADILDIQLPAAMAALTAGAASARAAAPVGAR